MSREKLSLVQRQANEIFEKYINSARDIVIRHEFTDDPQSEQFVYALDELVQWSNNSTPLDDVEIKYLSPGEEANLKCLKYRMNQKGLWKDDDPIKHRLADRVKLFVTSKIR